MAIIKVPRATISRHELEVFHVLSTAHSWLTVTEVLDRVRVPMSDRVVRDHLARLADQGIAVRMRMTPGFRFRIADDPGAQNPEYLARLSEAAEIFGINREESNQ